MTAYQFAVLQYVPDPVRQESVNVGVIVAAPGASTAEVRILKTQDTARLKWLGFKDDVGFLHDVADDLARPTVANGVTISDVLTTAHQQWAGTIRVTELRAALHDDPRDLCEELYGRYVANPRTRRRPAYRDRRAARRKVTTALRGQLPREAVKPQVKVPGHYEAHPFDLGLYNGHLLHAIAAFSFEAPDRETLQTEVAACAWAITDVRAHSPYLPITVVTIGSGSRVDHAERMYGGLGARLIREGHIDEWARGVASELEPVLKAHSAGVSQGQRVG
jgi:Protein of unknown function (DUF3037)